MRCVHLNRIGEQCRDQALEGGQLCPYHTRIFEDEDLDQRFEVVEGRRDRVSRYPLIYRLAAGALLLLFVMQIYQTVVSWLGY
jgi:hypothetical protein